MTNFEQLANILTQPGTWTFAYVDDRSALPQVEEEAKQQAVTNRLLEAGAPQADADAIGAALTAKTGMPSPSARYLLAREGQIEIDESFQGHRLGPERLGSGSVPEILPLLRHRAGGIRYLVVETGREGAQVRLERADQHGPEQVEDVEGRADSLTKVQAGGLSHARYQRAAEEVWKHNQSEVADVVARLVLEHHPDFIVLAGDVRARQMLREGLNDAAQKLVIEVESHTRADGSDSDSLDLAIAEAAASHAQAAITKALDRAREDNGRAGADGTEAVLRALQEARVDTLVLDAQLIDFSPTVDSARTLLALDAAPWVAVNERDALDAKPLGYASGPEAFARAAVLTGARVLISEEQYASADEPRTEQPDAREPVAALRWTNETA